MPRNSHGFQIVDGLTPVPNLKWCRMFTAKELVNREVEWARAQREHAERQKEREVEQVRREEQQKVAALD